MPSNKRSRQSTSIADFSTLPKDVTTHSVEDIGERQNTCQLGCCIRLQGVRIPEKQFERYKAMVELHTVTFLFWCISWARHVVGVSQKGNTYGINLQERK
jgi:hypothetical protein